MDEHPVERLLPGEPHAVRLMNTIWADRAGVHDALVDEDDLRAVLTTFRMGDADRLRLTGRDVSSARRLRDALRRLAAVVTDDDRPTAATGLPERDAIAAINLALAAAPAPVLHRSGSGWVFEPAEDRSAAGALGRLAREGAALVADPDSRLRACRAPGCVLYFVKDHPRREWCGVACGNRARAARHYARARSAAPPRS